jgi:hypothetical protein
MKAPLIDAVWQLSTAMFEYVTQSQQTAQPVSFLLDNRDKMLDRVSRAACENVVVAR